ncbi:hypothetical protein [Metabacillus sp. FJAT-52054]|uniref:Uncharacterized protein n=1 Tax=Metabacillus sediminis TaxID=3117746 RepID=A0ABZ2NEP4_9BACI
MAGKVAESAGITGEVAGKQVSPAGKREGTAGKTSLADSSFVRQNRQTKRPSYRLSDKAKSLYYQYDFHNRYIRR